MDWVRAIYRRLFGFRRCSEATMLASDLDLELAERDGDVDEKFLVVIRQGFNSPRATEQIAAAIELRKRLAMTYGPDRLRWMVAHLRDRFILALGADKAKAATADAPSLQDTNPEALLAEAHSLLEQLKLSYTLVTDRDARVNLMRGVSVAVLALLFAALAVIPAFDGGPLPFLALAAEDTSSFLNFLVVFVAAAAGALVSILQRSGAPDSASAQAQDPVRQISALRHGVSGIFVSAFMGPALAIVMLAVFVGGMIEIPGLTPKLVPCGPGTVQCTFSMLDYRMGFETYQDAAKLLLWAFLAGFAERLVPDVLDRFVGAAKTKPDV